MPANRRKAQQTNKRYRGAPVDGNLALSEAERRLESTGRVDFDRVYHSHPQTYSDRASRRRQKTKAAVRPAQHVSALTVMCVMAVSGLMVVLLVCYAQLNAISVSIVDMKEQISDLEVEQVRLLTEYEKDFDLASVNEKAQEAGMKAPSDSQIYYIDLPGADQAVSCAGEESGLSRMAEGLQARLHAILAYFQ